MMSRSFVRPLFVALSLAFVSAAAAPALADDGNAKSAELSKKGGDHKGKGKGKKDRASFPMKADAFTKHVDARLTKAKGKIDAALTKHAATDAVKAKVQKDFDDGAALVRAAAKRVGKDGEVTKEEAKEVRAIAKTLRKDLRAKYLPKKAADKSPVGKEI